MGDQTRGDAPTRPLHRATQEYFGKALIWWSYETWTVEETANLLCGCIPDRRMFGLGERNQEVDRQVVAMENLIRADLGEALQPVTAKRYFGRTFIRSRDVLSWAGRNHVEVPDELLKAFATRHQQTLVQGGAYTTPYLEAIAWIVKTFWQGVDLRDPPEAKAVVAAVRKQFQGLSEPEAQMLDRVTRHPAARAP